MLQQASAYTSHQRIGGPDSPKMRSTFCGPVLRIEHDGVTNLIYKLVSDEAPIR